ncbi:hypothetical protein N7540_008314 [Penicillium herquei]|nr:hypothetical protein N7540_008314 [Penicillium herquei]
MKSTEASPTDAPAVHLVVDESTSNQFAILAISSYVPKHVIPGEGIRSVTFRGKTESSTCVDHDITCFLFWREKDLKPTLMDRLHETEAPFVQEATTLALMLVVRFGNYQREMVEKPIVSHRQDYTTVQGKGYDLKSAKQKQAKGQRQNIDDSKQIFYFAIAKKKTAL